MHISLKQAEMELGCYNAFTSCCFFACPVTITHMMHKSSILDRRINHTSHCELSEIIIHFSYSQLQNKD